MFFTHKYQRAQDLQSQLPPITLTRISPQERRKKIIIVFAVVVCFATLFIVSGVILLTQGQSFSRDLCPGSGTPVNYNAGQQTARGRHYSPLGKGITIDLSFGSLDFTVAKSIDIAWDIIVGRGGQLLLLWIAHKVYVATLDHVTETSAVGYDFYLALAFDIGPWAMVLAIRNQILATRKHVIKVLFILYSVAYIAMFPTLMSAMTGYTNYTSPYIVFEDQSMIPLEDFMGSAERYGDTLVLNGTWYPLDYDMTNCLDHPSGHYSYGFSKLVWKLVCGLHLYWVLGMFFLWLDACLHSQLYQAGHRIGKIRAILDVAESLKEDLGPDTCAYTGAQLKKELQKRNPRLTYYQTRKGIPLQIGLSSQSRGGPIDLDAARGCLFGKQPEIMKHAIWDRDTASEFGGSPALTRDAQFGRMGGSDFGSPALTRDAEFGRLDNFETVDTGDEDPREGDLSYSRQ
ncbi:uncharacterized protein LAJ45_04566 [Morchella importuna]|uniref:Uncharacterized protein n=1 Tax=Morchella conica CCBAS932 TaxID=1392247 RepID=A0A3N4KXR5_9PEZI|nr:uncharacterized protein LAJ45_04566 [Morchella importuna]KAH8151364.1 hypothetical protein LAJ45_04566 [Morchella importuna]RPB14278.1 hypothetical protein P167DRAFT_534124 [Morchella conica CCBAS932]